MSRRVFCKKLNKEVEGLAMPPYPGELGQRIYANISAPAWQAWLNQQTMLINECRLHLADKKSREFLEAEMEKFLFGEGAAKPAGYVPEE